MDCNRNPASRRTSKEALSDENKVALYSLFGYIARPLGSGESKAQVVAGVRTVTALK
jgi:hypothetical protein